MNWIIGGVLGRLGLSVGQAAGAVQEKVYNGSSISKCRKGRERLDKLRAKKRGIALDLPLAHGGDNEESEEAPIDAEAAGAQAAVRERLGVREALERWVREHIRGEDRVEMERLVQSLLDGLSEWWKAPPPMPATPDVPDEVQPDPPIDLPSIVAATEAAAPESPVASEPSPDHAADLAFAGFAAAEAPALDNLLTGWPANSLDERSVALRGLIVCQIAFEAMLRREPRQAEIADGEG